MTDNRTNEQIVAKVLVDAEGAFWAYPDSEPDRARYPDHAASVVAALKEAGRLAEAPQAPRRVDKRSNHDVVTDALYGVEPDLRGDSAVQYMKASSRATTALAALRGSGRLGVQPTHAQAVVAAREYHDRVSGAGRFDTLAAHVRQSLAFRMKCALTEAAAMALDATGEAGCGS